MKFSTLTLLTALATAIVASPVYEVRWVTQTFFTTVTLGHSDYTAAHPDVETAATTTEAVTTVAPVTTDVAETTPTTTDATASTSTSSSASSTSSGTLFSGEGTWYDTGLGACGITNVDTDYIVAISHEYFDEYTPGTNPNENTLCGKKIIAYYNGKSVEVTATDRCEGCSYYDLDFSPSAFSELADQLVGRIDITWEWV